MDADMIQTIANIAFAVAILIMAVVSLMAIYVFIRYGRSRSFAVIASLIFAGVFTLGTLGALITLQSIF